MTARVAGVLIFDGWDLRRAARRIFPGSPVNARKWVHAWRYRAPIPRVPISGSLAPDPAHFVRQSHIPHGTHFTTRRSE